MKYLLMILLAWQLSATPMMPSIDYEAVAPPAAVDQHQFYYYYYYTQWVPGPGGVLPQDVFVPVGPAVHTQWRPLPDWCPPGEAPVDTPEPSTGLLIVSGMLLLLAYLMPKSWARPAEVGGVGA